MADETSYNESQKSFDLTTLTALKNKGYISDDFFTEQAKKITSGEKEAGDAVNRAANVFANDQTVAAQQSPSSPAIVPPFSPPQASVHGGLVQNAPQNH